MTYPRRLIGQAALAGILLTSPILVAGTDLKGVESTAGPECLAASEWSGIRAAFEKQRHAIESSSDGSHLGRNPGQAWVTKFDRRGFTVMPDSGAWTWGIELEGYGEATEVRRDGGKLSYLRQEGLTEWFINDSRGLEQGWTLEKRPDRLAPSGPVRLDLSVRGGLRPKISSGGSSVAFLNETGGVALNYGGLKAWDADGRDLHVRFAEGEGGKGGICVVVNDHGARYPITVDPVAQQAYFKASNAEAGDYFGFAVAVSGNTVVIGAPSEDGSAAGVNGEQSLNSATSSGAAYVFVKNGTTWTQQAYLKASTPEESDNFGHSVAVDGDTIVIGAPFEDSNAATDSGAAFVFSRSGSNWIQQAHLKASNVGPGDQFGVAVSVSGNTVVIGAGMEDSGAAGVNDNQADNSLSDAGAAYVFTRSGEIWSQQAYVKASTPGSLDQFGSAISVSNDTLVVGAYDQDSAATGVNGIQADESAPGSGAAYVFQRSGTTWNQVAFLKASNTQAADYFGFSVGVSGEAIVVGARYEDSGSSGINGDQTDNSVEDSGAAYVFVRDGSTWLQQAYLKASNPGPSDRFGFSSAVSGNVVVVGGYREDSAATGSAGDQSDNSALDSGAAYAFVRDGVVWNQQTFLKASNAGGEFFGYSVSVSGSTAVVGARLEDSVATGVDGEPSENGAEDSGAAYVFGGLGAFQLSATGEFGSILGTGIYESGFSATLTAVPDPGYVFAGWSGDATGSANPLTVMMDSSKAVTATFSPDTADTDDDGLTNYEEIVEQGTNPALPDTDEDGVEDGDDAFPLNPAETLDTDGDGIGDNADLDDDGDGLADADEIAIYGTNPKRADSDGDGLNDKAELEVHVTDPLNPDHDGDGLSDGAEFLTHLTDPKIADSDEDGFLDGYEVLTGKLPLDPLSKPALVAEARTAIEFTFPSALGKVYRIEGSTDLSVWTTIESGIAGNGGVIQRFYTTRNLPKRYFRVEDETP